MPNANNLVTRIGDLIENLTTAAQGSYFPFPLPYEDNAYLEDLATEEIPVKNTSEENHQLRIAAQAPSLKIQKATKEFASKLEIRFTQQYDIFQNAGGNNKARKAAIGIFGGIVGGLIPSKLGFSGVEMHLGDSVQQSVEAVNEYLDDAQMQHAQNIIALFADEDEAMRSIREDVLEPFAKRTMRNFEDQIEALQDDSVSKFLDSAIDRIFHVLSQPSNPDFASVNSKSNTPMERLNKALLYRTGSNESLFTKEGVKWNLESMLTKPRIKTLCQNDDQGKTVRIDEGVFVHPLLDRNDGKYGERWGTQKEAVSLGYQKFDNRRQGECVLTNRLLESSDPQKQKIGKYRKQVEDAKNEEVLGKSERIEEDEKLSFYCKNLRNRLREALTENPSDYRNLHLISNDLVQDLTLANAPSITSAGDMSLVESFCKSDANAVVKYMHANPSSSISQIIATTRTCPPSKTSATGFDKVKDLMGKMGGERFS